MNFEQQDIINVLKFYLTHPSSAHWHPLGNGHINQTFLVNDGDNKFVLQRINDHVFPNPQAVVDNAVLVNDFLKNHSSDYHFATIAPIKSLNGNYLEHINNGYWRAIEFVKDSASVDLIEQPKQAFDAASAFAKFSCALAEFDSTKLYEVISKFHDLEYRMLQLEQAIANDYADRVSDVDEFIAQIYAEQDFTSLVDATLKTLPQRVTHNDTKINNLLFNSKTMTPLAIIDLDTCMPGYLLHDFGDMVRTCCSSLSEDATNIEQMSFKQDIYQALYQGYIAGADGVITKNEIDALPVGARLMPFLLTLRFLADYLDGDKYFNISHPSHNLDRAKNQFKLYQLVSKSL